MADHPLAKLADVGFTTSGSVILRDIHLTVEAGEILGVTGANGAGKTTLLRILATLYRPTSGACSVLGADTRARSALASIRRRIALVGHSPALWPELTLRENLHLPALLRGEAPTDDPLHAVGLAGVAGLRAPGRPSACSAGWSSRGCSPGHLGSSCSTSRTPASTPPRGRLWTAS